MAQGRAGSRAVRAPAWPSSAALAAAALSVALVAVELTAGSRAAFSAAVAGYVAGALAVTVLVQVHRLLRRRASASPWYNPASRLDRVATLAVALGLATGAWHAFVVATELAK